MTLADKLRLLEDEILTLHPDATELLAEISRMICDLELGTASYSVVDGDVVRIPSP